MGRAEGVWHDELELLAAIVESIDGQTRLQYQAASGKRPPWPPVHVPRPAEAAGTRSSSSSTPARMAALIAAAEVSPPNGN